MDTPNYWSVGTRCICALELLYNVASIWHLFHSSRILNCNMMYASAFTSQLHASYFFVTVPSAISLFYRVLRVSILVGHFDITLQGEWYFANPAFLFLEANLSYTKQTPIHFRDLQRHARLLRVPVPARISG